MSKTDLTIEETLNNIHAIEERELKRHDAGRRAISICRVFVRYWNEGKFDDPGRVIPFIHDMRGALSEWDATFPEKEKGDD